MYECNYMNVWLSVYGGGGREGTGTGEAYIALSLDIGSFVQEHLRHFRMTIHSGPDESSPIILSETDTHSERDTSRWMIPPTTHRHTCRGTWHIWTHRHATAGCIVHHDFTVHYTMQHYHPRRCWRPYISSYIHIH